jgi:hypothetical protein
MRLKNIILILLIPFLGFASLNIEKISKVLSSIQKNGKSVQYFSRDKAFISKLSILKTNDLDSADIVIFPTSNLDTKNTIVDSFDKLKRSKNSIGAIYLKKGRTQILLVEERLKEAGLFIEPKYDKYIIKECYLTELCLVNWKF